MLLRMVPAKSTGSCTRHTHTRYTRYTYGWFPRRALAPVVWRFKGSGLDGSVVPYSFRYICVTRGQCLEGSGLYGLASRARGRQTMSPPQVINLGVKP